MAQIIWSPRAIEDLTGILDYIERDSAFYARLFGEKLLGTIEFAAKNPLTWGGSSRVQHIEFARTHSAKLSYRVSSSR